jgi:hypothetical protein
MMRTTTAKSRNARPELGPQEARGTLQIKFQQFEETIHMFQQLLRWLLDGRGAPSVGTDQQ